MKLDLLAAVLHALADLPILDLLWGVFIRLWVVVAYYVFFWLVLLSLAALVIVAAWLALRRTRAPSGSP